MTEGIEQTLNENALNLDQSRIGINDLIVETGSNNGVTVAGKCTKKYLEEYRPKGGNPTCGISNIAFGTAYCCNGEFGSFFEKDKRAPFLFPVDTNVYDIQPMILPWENKQGRYLAYITVGSGCSGEGVRLIIPIRARIYDVYNPHYPMFSPKQFSFNSEQIIIRPDIEGKKIWIDNCGSFYSKIKKKNQEHKAILNKTGSFQLNSSNVNTYTATYNSADLPNELSKEREIIQSMDITSQLIELGVDIDESLTIAKEYVKTRRTYS